MAILKPANISPNNIALDAKNSITISWQNLGDRQYYYQIQIYNNSTGVLVYDTTKLSSFNTFHLIPANTLTNGIIYKYQITVWNQLNEFATSDWIIFKCSSTPTCSITNLGSEVLNSSYMFQGSYFQAENVPIKSWRFILYDIYGSIISMSDETFNSTIEYQFIGLKADTDYQIELQVKSQDNLLGTTGKIQFHVRYEVPATALTLTAENLSDLAAIRLSWKAIQIIGKVISGSITFINGEKIDLTSGIIAFQDGMPNFKNFNLKLWLQWQNLKNNYTIIQVDTCLGQVPYTVKDNVTEILRLKSPIGDIFVSWEYLDETGINGRFILINDFYDVNYKIYSETISPIVGNNIFLGIDFINNLCNIHTEIL